MTPVFQRIISATRGDCMSCCIATILDMPYEQVPAFVAVAYDNTAANVLHGDPAPGGCPITLPGHPAGTPWRLHHFDAYMTDWLRHRGWFMVRVPDTLLTDFRALVGAYCIVSMPSQDFPGHAHAVIGQWVKIAENHHRLDIVHDPNPGNKPYGLDVEPTGVTFLVPLDPGRIAVNDPWKGGL
jgi:hypothetical protein